MANIASEQRFCELLDALLEASEDVLIAIQEKASEKRLSQAQRAVRAARELVDRAYRRALESAR